jgi:hypothetical protein
VGQSIHTLLLGKKLVCFLIHQQQARSTVMYFWNPPLSAMCTDKWDSQTWLVFKALQLLVVWELPLLLLGVGPQHRFWNTEIRSIFFPLFFASFFFSFKKIISCFPSLLSCVCMCAPCVCVCVCVWEREREREKPTYFTYQVSSCYDRVHLLISYDMFGLDSLMKKMPIP